MFTNEAGIALEVQIEPFELSACPSLSTGEKVEAFKGGRPGAVLQCLFGPQRAGGSAASCIVHGARGEGAVKRRHPPHQASTSEPAVPEATALCCSFVLVSESSCALWHVCLHVSSTCGTFFFFEANYLGTPLDVVCAHPSHTPGDVIFTNGVTFLSAARWSFLLRPIGQWHMER